MAVWSREENTGTSKPSVVERRSSEGAWWSASLVDDREVRDETFVSIRGKSKLHLDPEGTRRCAHSARRSLRQAAVCDPPPVRTCARVLGPVGSLFLIVVCGRVHGYAEFAQAAVNVGRVAMAPPVCVAVRAGD